MSEFVELEPLEIRIARALSVSDEISVETYLWPLDGDVVVPEGAVPIMNREPGELMGTVEKAVGLYGMVIYVGPPLPIRAMQGVPFVFIEAEEVAVQIYERPSKNPSEVSAWSLRKEIMLALHYQQFAGLQHPLILAARPCDDVPHPTTRITKVLFRATYALSSRMAGVLDVTEPDGLVASGVIGGPFTPDSKTFTLNNTGAQPLKWRAAGQGMPWLTLSPASGTIEPASSTIVTATIAAEALAAGPYTGAVSFINHSNSRQRPIIRGFGVIVT